MAAEMIGNRYIIVKQIGEGGMATVYLSIDTILKREVAIKVLKSDLSADEVSLKRFQREAMAITSTSHPNIVEVFDVGQDGNRNYIVMEYVHGKTLKQLIRQRGIISIDEAVNIMKQLVSAVAHAHHQGIIHRDIKSQNVLIKDDGTVKLSDFGIAQMGDSAQQLTQAETVVGSVHYLAPELASGKPASFQSDIYSLGIVFYEMLTGDVPFHGDTAVEIALKHMHNDVPAVRDFNPTIPQSVENIVTRATSRKKELRYENADKMYNDLVTCLDATREDEEKIDLSEESQEIKKQEQESEKKKNEKKIRVRKGSERTSNIILISLLVLLLVLVGIVASKGSSNSNKVRVPDVMMYDLEEASAALQQLELKIERVDYEVTEDVEKGHIISISPASGTEVSKGSSVVLTVSLGQNFTVEDYTGQMIEQVKAKLERAGFAITVRYVDDSEKRPYGTIVSQNVKEGTVFSPDQAKNISFDIADYPTFTIPSTIKGMDVEEAKKLLENLGAVVVMEKLNIEENIDENGNYINPVGVVVNCKPALGTIYRQTDDDVLTIYYY